MMHARGQATAHRNERISFDTTLWCNNGRIHVLPLLRFYQSSPRYYVGTKNSSRINISTPTKYPVVQQHRPASGVINKPLAREAGSTSLIRTGRPRMPQRS